MMFLLNRKGKALVPVLVASMLVLAAGLAGSIALAQPSPAPAENGNTVSVSGSAQVALKPDIAYVTLGVLSADSDFKKAGAANDTAMAKVLSAVKAQGVEDKDIQTVNYSINPRYSADGKTITGYEVNNSVRVKVRSLDKLGAVLSDATTAGANSAYGLSFDVEDREAAYNQALTMAIKDAKQRAETLAKSAGTTLGTVLSVSESGGYTPYPIFVTWDKAAASPMSPGSLNVTASVNVTYALQ